LTRLDDQRTAPESAASGAPPGEPDLKQPLLDESELASPVRKPRRTPLSRRLRAGLSDRLWGTESRAKRTRLAIKIGTPILVVAIGLGAYFALRPYPQPDYKTGRIDDLMYFTLLREEFNNLPIEDRIKLLAELRERFEGLSKSESVLLAAFMGGVMGEARDQFEENASKLAIDLWDSYAQDYPMVPVEERGAYLDQSYVRFVRTMETLSGQDSDKTDQELIQDARRQARRDQESAREGNVPDGRVMGFMFNFLSYDVGSHASPHQKARGHQMMKDMVRHMRGGG